mmetsp:Transcript_25150/g.18936  ORF Transcript_25150/g.18936 Transcript_25150/m.18936 type:complete len:80 (-) Transcript_25150:112-351(-)
MQHELYTFNRNFCDYTDGKDCQSNLTSAKNTLRYSVRQSPGIQEYKSRKEWDLKKAESGTVMTLRHELLELNRDLQQKD